MELGSQVKLPTKDCLALVHFEPEPDTSLNGYSVAKCLLVLGWSERTLGRRLGRSQTDIRRIIEGKRSLTAYESAWLVKLSSFMTANPAPRRKVVEWLS